MKRIEAAEAENFRHLLGVGNGRRTRSKGEIDEADGADSEETKRKRRTKNDGGEGGRGGEGEKASEEDGRIRKGECVGPSLDECEFHRVAIGLLRKPVALSCAGRGTYTQI